MQIAKSQILRHYPITAYTNEIVHQRKRQLCILGKTFHITPQHSRNPRAVVTLRLCERSLAGSSS